MISLENTELLHQVVQELAYTAPEGWKKIVYYQELLPDPEGSLRNKSTGRCWLGDEMTEYSQGYKIGRSMEVFRAFKKYYEDTKTRGLAWKGLLITIFEDGKFRTQPFYEKSPLLDGDSTEVNKIIDSAG